MQLGKVHVIYICHHFGGKLKLPLLWISLVLETREIQIQSKPQTSFWSPFASTKTW